jgi:general secretion pathway protein M
MNRFAFNRIALFQLLTVLAIAMPLLGAVYVVWVKHQRLQVILADIEPRYARLQGLVDSGAAVQALDSKAGEQLASVAYPATQDATKSGNDAQQRISSLLAESKVEVMSTQVLPAKEAGKFDKIAINVRIEGELPAVKDALLKLSTQAPAILIDSMALQTIGAVRPANTQRLSGQFSFAVYRVRR